MTEDPSTPPATTSGNQNLNMRLALGAVVLLLFLLVLQMTGGGFGGGQSEVEKLKAERDARQDALNNKLGTSGPLVRSHSAQTLATRLSTDSATLAGLVTRMQAMLTTSEANLKTANNTVQHLSQQLANSASSAAENVQLKNQLLAAQTRASQAESLVGSLHQQLSAVPSSAAMEATRRQLDEALKTRDSHRDQLTQLQTRMKDMEASDVANSLREQLDPLTKKVASLETENNRLGYEVQKLRADLDRARLFVEAEALPAKAKLLYDELARLETANPAQLKTEYERINQELGASVVDRITFQTNSSRIPFDKVEEIRRAVQASGNDSFILVVGYASKSGDLASNRTLSADRATRLASVTNTHKKKDQGVQAVFLAETDRFDAADLAPNQVCEIWEVRK